MKIKLMLMGIFGTLAALVGCGSSAKKISEGKTSSGPFEIRWEVFSTESGAWFNNGGDHRARVLTSYFSVYHNGKIIVIPSVDIKSKGEKIDFFWQALFLKDAKEPAVLVGTHSMYLITDVDGEPKVTPVHEDSFGGFAFFQWLDSNNGQPGVTETVIMGDDSKRDRFLSGGRYLMVNGRKILDVETLKIYPFEPTGKDGTEVLDQYNPSNSAILQASPDGKQLMLIGSRTMRQGDILFERYALVSVEIVTNHAYAVPFSRTETRFSNVHDLTQKWIETYFEWRKNGDGGYTLASRKLEKLPYFKGRYSYDQWTKKRDNFELIPVKQSMINVFYDFLKAKYHVTEISREIGPNNETESIKFEIDGIPLSLYFRQEERTLWFQGKVAGQIEPFAKAFDAELELGNYQEHFGEFRE